LISVAGKISLSYFLLHNCFSEKKKDIISHSGAFEQNCRKHSRAEIHLSVRRALLFSQLFGRLVDLILSRIPAKTSCAFQRFVGGRGKGGEASCYQPPQPLFSLFICSFHFLSLELYSVFPVRVTLLRVAFNYF